MGTWGLSKLIGQKSPNNKFQWWIIAIGILCVCVGYISYSLAPSDQFHQNGMYIANYTNKFFNQARSTIQYMMSIQEPELNTKKYLTPQLEKILHMSEMQAYIKNIQRIAKEFLVNETMSPTFINQSARTYQAPVKGYFEDLSVVSSVRTVFLQKDFDKMRKLILTDCCFQYYSSNNCQLYTYTNTNNKTTKSASCVDETDNLRQLHNLTYRALNSGLPPNYHQKQGQEVWTYMHVVQNGIVSRYGHIRTQNVTITPYQCNWKLQDKWPDMESHNNHLTVHDEVFVCTQYWGYGFYHSTLETVPRLAAHVQLLNENPEIKIYMMYRANKYIIDALGIKNLEERILTSNNFRARILYVPAGGPCGDSPFFTTYLLSLYAKQYYISLHNLHKPKKRNKIVLIKRSEKRFFRNHDAIEAMLQDTAVAFNMSLFIFRDDPLPDTYTTMSMFNEAAVIVAPHGAGESNMIYSQPGTVLIEGMHKEKVSGKYNTVYLAASKYLGLRFYGLVFESGVFDITPEQVRKPLEFFLKNLKF